MAAQGQLTASAFPAPAGMNRPFNGQLTLHHGVPRASGDEPIVY